MDKAGSARRFASRAETEDTGETDSAPSRKHPSDPFEKTEFFCGGTDRGVDAFREQESKRPVAKSPRRLATARKTGLRSGTPGNC